MSNQTTENNKRIAKNTMFLYMRMIVMMLVMLYTARVVLQSLGFENYGIYNVVGSIIVFFVFINNGLGGATKRYILTEIAKGDYESQRNVFNLAFTAHVLIAAVIFVLAESIGLWIINSILNIPESRMLAANICYQLSILTAIISIISAPFGATIVAQERMSIYAYLSITDAILNLGVAFLIGIIPGDVLITYSSLMCLVSIINAIINWGYCFKSFPMCRFKRPHNKRLLKEIFSYMGWSLAGQGAVVLTNQGVNMLINIFCGIVVNAAMGISNQVTNVVNKFVMNFQIAFNPQITKYYAVKDYANLIKLVNRSTRYSSYLVLVFLVPICFETKNLLSIWLGKFPEYAVSFSLLTIISVYFEAVTAPLWMVLCSDKRIKKYQIVVSLVFLINFFGSLILLYFGTEPYHVMTLRIAVNIMLILVRLAFVKRRIVDFPVLQWLSICFIKNGLIVIVPLLVTGLLYTFAFKNNFVELLIVGGLGFTLTCLSIFFIGFTRNEKNFVLSKIKINNYR